jgi:subtilisin family serine protease
LRSFVWLLLVTALAASEAFAQFPKPTHANLDSRLSAVVDAHERGQAAVTARALAANPLGTATALPVSIRTSAPAAVRQLLGASGGIVRNALENTIEAHVTPAALAALARSPLVEFVSELLPPEPMEVSQGQALHNASHWLENHFNGAGVKVGVIDTGFLGIASMLSRELPGNVVARCYTGMGQFTSSLAACDTATVHGTAVAETLFDMAPGVELYIATPLTPGDLRSTVDWMITQGIQVINHSVGWQWDGPGDGTSPSEFSPLRSVDAAVTGGAVFVNAAGNQRETTWLGTMVDSNNNDFLEVSPGIDFNEAILVPGQEYVIQLRWQDSWTAAAIDLDLYVYDAFGREVARSTIVQAGQVGQTPYEVVRFSVPIGEPHRIGVRSNAPVTPGWVQVQGWRTGPFTYQTGSSIANPAESSNTGMLAVGAANFQTPGTLETFSSIGPTIDGRIKPDLVAADGADTASYGTGSNAFLGTSQSAPHVAGMAALVRDAFPAFTPAQVVSYLKGNASPRGAVPNNSWGHGFAMLPSLCTPVLTPASRTVGPAGETGQIGVAIGSPCSWTAVSSNTGIVSITAGGTGTGPGTVSYTVAANAAVGQRTATITIAGRVFTLTQYGTGPIVAVDRTALNFGATSNGVAFVQRTSPQLLRLTQTSGTASVPWTATPNQPWLRVTPTSGPSLPATLTVDIEHTAGMPSAVPLTGTITLAFTGAGSEAGPVSVTLTVSSAGTSGSPVGAFDTPADNVTGVTGSLALTGWALDDIEVTRVKILQSPLPGQCVDATGTPHQSLVFVGDASLVDGARPDVVAAFPSAPRNTRAGWGYMLLTNFLGGDELYTLCAFADDAEGHSALIGMKRITLANANAGKPFGAIDRPFQGEVIAGTTFNNFGWVLALGEDRADPPGGGTVTVFIDGNPAGAPTGWTSRSDLSALFPAAMFPGIVNALGVFTFNPAALGDGVHTIAWSVTDSGGETDGVGSRYFTVASGGAGTVSAAPAGALTATASVPAAPSGGPLRARRGFDVMAPFHRVGADASGRASLDAEELDRIELQLPGVVSGALHDGRGYGSLPIGSTLDVSGGRFAWQPGVGFVGRYEFRFTRRDGTHQDVTITLHPRGSNRVGPQVMIDTPNFVEPGFSRTLTIAGWAVDLDDGIDTGVATVHVWAYPVDPLTGERLQPVFLGAAAYGGLRPDVAVTFGERYLRSGYSLTVDHLDPGTYDIAVFAWSTLRREFAPARVVRVRR